MLAFVFSNYTALQEFFKDTNGKISWKNTDNWANTTDYCKYYGVECDSNKNVISLMLRSNGLTGKIPEALEGLKHLRYLDLSNSTFESKLRELCNVPSLEVIAIEDSNVNFEIPSCFCEMPNLRILDLTDNRITGPIPSCLKAETLHLGCNSLNGEFGYELNNLKEVSYGCNTNLVVDWTEFKGVITGENECHCTTDVNCLGIWKGLCGVYVHEDKLEEYLESIQN